MGVLEVLFGKKDLERRIGRRRAQRLRSEADLKEEIARGLERLDMEEEAEMRREEAERLKALADQAAVYGRGR